VRRALIIVLLNRLKMSTALDTKYCARQMPNTNTIGIRTIHDILHNFELNI